jgi:hypothetical protein
MMLCYCKKAQTRGKVFSKATFFPADKFIILSPQLLHSEEMKVGMNERYKTDGYTLCYKTARSTFWILKIFFGKNCRSSRSGKD